MAPSTRDRLVRAAFELFEEQGYDGTTVEDIAARAGTGRTTLFRHFRTKEQVVFPDHDQILPRVDARLATATPESRDVALREAARIVLEHYLAEGEVARARYRLTSSIPALRDREAASVQRYLRLYSRHTRGWLAGEPDGPLRAELLAASVITAHNHVLRAWLRGSTSTPREDLDHALDIALAATTTPGPRGADAAVVVLRGGDVDALLGKVARALGASDD